MVGSPLLLLPQLAHAALHPPRHPLAAARVALPPIRMPPAARRPPLRRDLPALSAASHSMAARVVAAAAVAPQRSPCVARAAQPAAAWQCLQPAACFRAGQRLPTGRAQRWGPAARLWAGQAPWLGACCSRHVQGSTYQRNAPPPAGPQAGGAAGGGGGAGVSRGGDHCGGGCGEGIALIVCLPCREAGAGRAWRCAAQISTCHGWFTSFPAAAAARRRQMERMEKSLESVRRNFSSVRTGRANPSMLDRIEVGAGAGCSAAGRWPTHLHAAAAAAASPRYDPCRSLCPAPPRPSSTTTAP